MSKLEGILILDKDLGYRYSGSRPSASATCPRQAGWRYSWVRSSRSVLVGEGVGERRSFGSAVFRPGASRVAQLPAAYPTYLATGLVISLTA